MLIYSPANDAANCAYRFLLIVESVDFTDLNWDAFRIADYYILYPYMLRTISPLPRSLAMFKKPIANIRRPYSEKVDQRMSFYTLEQIHANVASFLIAKGLFDIDAFACRSIKRTDNPIPDVLLDRIYNDPIRTEEWFKAIVDGLIRLDTNGLNGLKHRSRLMEYRYDES